MVKAISFPLSRQDIDEIKRNSSLALPIGVSELPMWIGTEYLVLCNGHIAYWVAKISEVVLPTVEDGKALVRFSEVRNVWNKDSNPFFLEVMSNFSRYDAEDQRITHSFDNDQFFSLGDPVPTLALDGPDALTLDRAVCELARIYGVKPAQVNITITSSHT
ncbi:MULTISPECIES: hypothetical protein [unclassified Pseudomonas]|uniref:hypothetical protein n=1 Tax=unclassified Pseudomonas TaxID=196821 RepID=UPI0005BD83A7|nr:MULTISPECIES: hypothetical protein [unclassified Pseudomonas]KWR85529.1 hypothetical protein RN02_02415 [Pseudomonas sp. PI1]MED5607777.1 hypothetical protein [Pseudomonas sp. JH-2]